MQQGRRPGYGMRARNGGLGEDGKERAFNLMKISEEDKNKVHMKQHKRLEASPHLNSPGVASTEHHQRPRTWD